MESIYTAGPTTVPENFTKSSKKFKKHVAFAILGLVLFVATYLGLMLWFGNKSYQLFLSLGGSDDNNFKKFLFAVLVGVLAIFMFKSLFIFNKRDKSKFQYLTKEGQPLLFDFIYQLADAAGAPRPHKVIVTSRVNASVFYDLNIFNLLFPSKKNLEIGLGLVNVVNLGEFKAILAHEFGHFAQKSMLLGRYVYVANQIASRIVNKRDALDAFIAGVSRFDLRIAWVGWILQILVWAVRSLIEVLFSVVVVAERALSREMEFQADLVAVSLTGSDDLINGLHKLRGADEAYNASLSIIDQLIADKKQIPDLFSLQSYYLKEMRKVLDDPTFGDTPSNFKAGIKTKIFNSTGINPPEMWATHPSDVDRENNAKKIYIPSLVEGRSTWILFADHHAIKEQATLALYNSIENLPECKLISNEEAEQKMTEEIFNWKFLSPEYKGIYRERLASIYTDLPEAFYSAKIDSDFKAMYQKTYPEDLKVVLDDLKEFTMEKEQLEARLTEVVTAEKRDIYFRGNKIKRSHVKQVLKNVEAEIQEKENLLLDHDRMVRTLNYEVAKTIGKRESDLHANLVGMLHFCDHSIFNLQDLLHHLHIKLAIAQSGGSGEGKLRDVINAANKIGDAIEMIFKSADIVETSGLQSEVFAKIPYKDRFEPCGLGMATAENINSFLNNFDGWYQLAVANITVLRNVTLERLLQVEEALEQAYCHGKPLNLGSYEIDYPANYKTLKKGQEEKKEFKLDFWDRFLAGHGLIPQAAKFLVAIAMVTAIIFFSNISTSNMLFLVNGLDTRVVIKMNDSYIKLDPFENTSVDVDYGFWYTFTATNENDELIETFRKKIDSRNSDFVYNIAGGTMLNEYTVVYGSNITNAVNQISNDRWQVTDADYIFTDAPESLYLKDYETSSRKVVQSLAEFDPNSIGFDLSTEASKQMITNHLKWDDPSSLFIISWLNLSTQFDTSLSIVEERWHKHPNEIETMRTLSDFGDENLRAKVCNTAAIKSEQEKDNANVAYIKVRCMDDGVDKDIAFESGFKKWPENPWFTLATSFTFSESNQWEPAYKRLLSVAKNNPAIFTTYSTVLERWRRVYDLEDASTIGDIEASSEVIYYRNLEDGIEETLQANSDKIFYDMKVNRYAMAIENAELQDSALNVYAKIMIAASKNAPRSVIEEVLSWDLDSKVEINYYAIYALIGLKIKEGLDISPQLEQLKQYISDEDSEPILAFMNAISKRNLYLAKQIMSNIKHYSLKSLSAVTAYVVFQEKTPETWKNFANRLLFISERPNFTVNDISGI